MDIIIFILLLLTFCLQLYKIHLPYVNNIEIKEEDKKQAKLKESFDNLMGYSIDKAIESKRGDK